jgi:hypothetical protein
MNELTPRQIAILERLVANGFIAVAFPLFASSIGIRKGNCAALLEPIPGGGLRQIGEPSVLLDGNLTVRVKSEGKSWFVWKNQRIEATPGRLAELNRFISELTVCLESHA